MTTFDETLSDDQRRRADILRRSISSETALAEYEAGADRIKQNIRDSVKRFDDIFAGNPSLLARSAEIRRRAKAEIYWQQASDDEKLAIREGVVSVEPFTGNELLTKHFLARRLDDIITDECVLNYLTNFVLGGL